MFKVSLVIKTDRGGWGGGLPCKSDEGDCRTSVPLRVLTSKILLSEV